MLSKSLDCPPKVGGQLLYHCKHYRSEEAYKEVEAFFEDHPDYPELLTNKIMQAAWPLYRSATR